MYYNVNEPIRSNINPSKNSQKSKNMFQPNIKVFHSPNQQNQNLIYNNNNNDYKNYNIRVNKVKNAPKEKYRENKETALVPEEFSLEKVMVIETGYQQS